MTNGEFRGMTPEIRRLLDEWRREADGYLCGITFESPVGDMNRASAKVLLGAIRELEAAPLALPADLPPTEARLRVFTVAELRNNSHPFEYDQGDVVLCHYDEIYDLLHAPAVPPPVEPPPSVLDVDSVGRRYATPPAPQDERGRAQWQPIETAPKDSDVLLLYQDGEGVQAGYWYDLEKPHSWVAVETQGLTGGRMQPTHWMPLPAAPVTPPEGE
jgi:hypothetical protein